MHNIWHQEIVLTNQLAANPGLLGRFTYTNPGVSLFLQNNGTVASVVHVKGFDGHSYYSDYGLDSAITLQPGGRQISHVSAVPETLAFYLSSINSTGGVYITVVGFAPLPDPLSWRESLNA